MSCIGHFWLSRSSRPVYHERQNVMLMDLDELCLHLTLLDTYFLKYGPKFIKIGPQIFAFFSIFEPFSCFLEILTIKYSFLVKIILGLALQRWDMGGLKSEKVPIYTNISFWFFLSFSGTVKPCLKKLFKNYRASDLVGKGSWSSWPTWTNHVKLSSFF